MDPKQIADGGLEFIFGLLAADGDTRVAIAGELVDGLLGTDKHALVENIPGLSPEMSETIFDQLKAMAVAKIQEKVGGP
jgi:hypothetical protein